jgi:hypothetical protein
MVDAPSSSPRFVYCCVARGDVVLAEFLHENLSRTLERVSRTLLRENVDCSKKMKNSFSCPTSPKSGGPFKFHVVCSDGLAHVVLARADVSRRTSFALLEKLKKEFVSQFGSMCAIDGMQLSEGAMGAEFAPYMKRLLKFYNCSQGEDKLQVVKGTLQDVKQSVVRNIEKALDRGEGLDEVCEKSAFLARSSKGFTMQSRALHRAMWWQNARTRCYIFFGALCLVAMGAMYMCGGPFLQQCRSASLAPSPQ